METFITLCNTTAGCSTKLVSDHQREIIGFVNYVILCGAASTFGSITNVINLIVFHRQGLDSTINISFFSLAVSDLCGLIFQQLFNVFINPWFLDLDLPIVYIDVQYLTTAATREMFARITCLITAFITAERCLCVTFPLQVKQMITPRVTTKVILVIFIYTLLSPVPMYFTSYLAWNFYSDLNTTLLGLAFTEHHFYTESFSYGTHAFFTLLGFLSVLIFTLILIYKLRQKNAWRQTANVDEEKAKSMIKRDRATMVMVVLIAGILVVCYTPAVLLSLATFLEPEFAMGGRFKNLCYILWSCAMFFENINSSINIFLYYNMSSKYRHTFKGLFNGCIRERKRDANFVCQSESTKTNANNQ